MKKNNWVNGKAMTFRRWKILLIMKLLAVFFLGFLMQSYAVVSQAQEKRLSLRFENNTLKEVLQKLEDQTEFSFIYKDELINPINKISGNFRDEKVTDLLDKVLQSENLTYQIKGRVIVILPNNSELVNGQQQKSVSGKVTDSSGAPLPGVSVVVKGTTTGTVTSTDGNYNLTVPSEKSVLVFSFIGLTTIEIVVGNQKVINVSLSEQTVGIDEVIAIGYGTTTKRSTTAAISKVKTDNLVNLPVANVTDALGGRSAGIIVSSSGGGIGNRPSISIRGGGTPILIIDGIMTSDINQLNRMNIKDVESFTVLKDAQAVAVYGSKGGNGAIVITTKRGEKGQFQINYGYNHNFSTPTVLPKKMSSYDIVSLRNQAADFDNQPHPYTDAVVEKYRTQSDPYNFPNTDWQKETLENFAQEYKHDLSLSGGNEKTNYYASLSYFDQSSLYKFDTNWLKRYTYRMSISNNFDNIGLKTSLSFFGDVEKTRAPYSSYSTNYAGTWGHIQNRLPMELAYTDLGLYSTTIDHPIVEIDPNAGYDKNDDRNVNGQLDVEWSVPKVKGLKLKLMTYYRNDNYFRKLWRVNADQYQLGSDVPIAKNPPSLELRAASGWRYRVQPFITFDRTFKKHNINAKFGYDETYAYAHDLNASRENYILNVDQIFAGPTESAKNNGVESEESNAGYVGILDYSYANKYMIGGSIRYDANDKFPSERRWGTFYSGSVGWIVTEENFAKMLKEKLKIDFFKMRFSYGETGLDDGVARYEYLPGYNMVERAHVVDGKIVPGFDEGALVSDGITWYQRKSVNTGVDFALLDNKLSGSADYFFYETTNFLGSPSGSTYADPLGTSLPKVNTNGKHRRAGWEFELKYKNRLGDLFYELGANATQFDVLWVNKFDESQDQLKNPRNRETQQLSFGRSTYISEGFYESAEDVINSPKRNSSYDLVPGDLKYRDVNGDGQLDGEDLVRSGKPTFPRLMYGFTIDLKYKAWSAGMLFQGTGDRSIYLENVIRNSNITSVVYPFQTDFWMPNNTNTIYPRLISNESFNGSNNGADSNFWLVNARYFRMKSLQVSFDFKQNLLKALPVNRFDVFLSGTNLLTFSKLFKKYKMDPEAAGGNNYGYPIQQVFSLGLNIGF